MQNYLYCFDSNYNIQATCSIYSLLKHNKSKVNIFIIHKNPESFKKYLSKINKFKNVNSINIFKFNFDENNFPNIEKSHVSEATYYRFYIDDYVPSEIKDLMYIDADIICKKDLSKTYYDCMENLEASKKIISVRTEKLKQSISKVVSDDKNDFLRLNLKSDKYFNAGVMAINFERWIENKIKNSLLETQTKIEDKILLWDQDVLNSYFDGNYTELDNNLNFDMTISVDNEMNIEYSKNLSQDKINKAILLHYSGKSKPWSVKGILHPLSKYYQEIYHEIFKKRYHIQNNWKKLAIKQAIEIISKKKISKIQYPVSFFTNFLRYLLK